jgi:antitoxin CptB
MASPVSTELIDARALSKLKWRCRRGLLENDLFIERFFGRYEKSLTTSQAQGLLALMDLGDNDLLDLLLRRAEPEGELLLGDAPQVLEQLRTAPRTD